MQKSDTFILQNFTPLFYIEGDIAKRHKIKFHLINICKKKMCFTRHTF